MKKFWLGLTAVPALLFAATAGAVAEKVLRIGVGDVLYVKSSKISCSVANPYKQMVCFKRKSNGQPKPGSYGTTTSGRFVAIVRFNSKGKPVPVTQKINK